ncbi:MAG: NAD(P)-binding domain-containing protein [Pseudomonadota bacterium]
MKIAVVGAGSVGGTLGRRWADVGHTIRFGVPDPQKVKYERLASIPNTHIATAVDAAQDADIIVLATPWSATQQAISSLGNLDNRVIIDCTNPLTFDTSGLNLVLGFDTSGGEQVASWANGAHVYKTLNQTGFNVMADPTLFPQRPVMFVAGDLPQHKATILNLVSDLGFDARDAGPLRIARLLEPYAMLWIHLAGTASEGRDFAFAHTTVDRRSSA